MDNPVYGVINSENCLIDTSLTLHGAKCHATRNGYDKVGKRVGYNVVMEWQKLGSKWVQKTKNRKK